MAYRYNTNRLDVEFRKRLKGLDEDDSPGLGGNLELNGYGFVAELTAEGALNAGDLCYLNGAGKMDQCDASVETTSRTLLGICETALDPEEAGNFILRGFYTNEGFITGGVAYASPTGGAIQFTPPNGSGEVVRVLGYGLSASQLFFNPDDTWFGIR